MARVPIEQHTPRQRDADAPPSPAAVTPLRSRQHVGLLGRLRLALAIALESVLHPRSRSEFFIDEATGKIRVRRS